MGEGLTPGGDDGCVLCWAIDNVLSVLMGTIENEPILLGRACLLAMTRVLLSSYASAATQARLSEAWELLTDVLNEETLRPPEDDAEGQHTKPTHACIHDISLLFL